MNCKLSCAIAGALLLGNVAVCMSADESIRHSGLLSTFSDHLRQLYQRSVAERRLLYYTGLGWGLVAAALVGYFRPTRKTPAANLGCLAGAVTLGIAYLFYMLMPKRHSVRPHLKTRKQLAAWADANKLFMRNYTVGLALGGAAGGFFGAAMCR